MRPYKFTIAASAALLASTSISSANVVVQTQNYSAPTNWGTSTETVGFSPTDIFSFTGFNPSLGTLNSVTITVAGSLTGTVDITYFGLSPTNVSAYLSSFLKFELPGIGQKHLSVTSNAYSDPSLAGGSSTGTQPVSGSTSTTYFYSSSLSTFETSWTVTAGDFGSSSASEGNGQAGVIYTDTGGMLITADYNYTPVTTVSTPEPAALTVLGTGLAGLGLLRRRRKSR